MLRIGRALVTPIAAHIFDKRVTHHHDVTVLIGRESVLNRDVVAAPIEAQTARLCGGQGKWIVCMIEYLSVDETECVTYDGGAGIASYSRPET